MKDIEVIFEEGSRGTQSAVDAAQKLLESIPKGYGRAASRALNRAATSGRAAGVATIRKTYTVKASAVRNAIGIKKATVSDLESIVYAKGPVIPLGGFKIKPTTDTTGARRKQVRVSVKKGGVKPLGDAFIYKGKVLRRLGTARLPVQELYGPSVAGMADSQVVHDNITDVMRDTFLKRLDHETDYILNQGGR